jgi:integrase
MAREINRLNARKVATLADPGLHADGNGLYLNVSGSGTKSWRLIYSHRSKRRELGLGSLTAVSLAEAREKTLNARKLLSDGIDPKAAWRKSEVPQSTFGEVATDFIEGHEEGWKNKKHRQQWRNTLATYAKPIWDKPVAEVDVDDLLQILRPIWTTKNETASRLRGRIERVLDVAKARRLRTGENPAAWRGNLSVILPKRKKGPKRHHPAMPFAEVPAFMQELCLRPALAARALKLTILTASRTSETLGARWSEIDLDAKLWIIPSERMKAGKEHRMPLSSPAMAVLQSLEQLDDFVFSGFKVGKHLSNMTMEMLLRRMEVDQFTVHGFRSSFRDWCGDKAPQFPREVAEQALAHAVGNEVERAYRRSDALEQRRELMDLWADYVCPRTADPNADPKVDLGFEQIAPNSVGQ